MTVKTLRRQLAAAIAMTLVSTVALGSSTYAWFTMNKTVTVTGMEVKTHVGSNLLIQAGALTDVTTLGEATFITDETQEIKKILEPVSTVDGKSFFYTLDAKANGAKLHEPIGSDDSNTINYTAYDITAAATGTNASDYANKFSQDYELNKTTAGNLITGEQGAVGYVDYVFQLKATNTEASAQDINLTKLDLTYGAATDGNKAYRAAVFVSDPVDVGGAFTNWSDSADLPTANAIYTPSGATNFDPGKAVNAADSRDTVTYVTAATAIASVPANSVKYYKIVVRLWIEGEDTTCYTNMFKPLTSDWKLDLEMQLGQGTGVTNINMATTTPADPGTP